MTREELLQTTDLFLLDLDGTVYLDETPIGDVTNTLARLRACGKRLVYLTNNSSKTEEEYRHSAVPARWEPMAETRAKPVYTSLRDLKKQLACEPEYKAYFALSRA